MWTLWVFSVIHQIFGERSVGMLGTLRATYACMTYLLTAFQFLTLEANMIGGLGPIPSASQPKHHTENSSDHEIIICLGAWFVNRKIRISPFCLGELCKHFLGVIAQVAGFRDKLFGHICALTAWKIIQYSDTDYHHIFACEHHAFENCRWVLSHKWWVPERKRKRKQEPGGAFRKHPNITKSREIKNREHRTSIIEDDKEESYWRLAWSKLDSTPRHWRVSVPISF